MIVETIIDNYQALFKSNISKELHKDVTGLNSFTWLINSSSEVDSLAPMPASSTSSPKRSFAIKLFERYVYASFIGVNKRV